MSFLKCYFRFWRRNAAMGFTVVELLLSITIIGVITTITVNGFRQFTQSRVLESAAELVSISVRKAQIWTLIGQRTGGTRASYGVHIGACTSQCSIIIFADTYPPDDPEAIPATTPNTVYDPGFDTIMNTEAFPPGIQIASVTPTDPSDIVYQPPKATALINGGTVEPELVIQVAHESVAEGKTLRIERISGLVSSE